jgi:hypothetical protein
MIELATGAVVPFGKPPLGSVVVAGVVVLLSVDAAVVLVGGKLELVDIIIIVMEE